MSKVALITGTNAGVGRALALEFNKRGVKVYATDKVFSEETLELFHEKGILTEVVDVTRLEDIKKIRARVNGENDGKLDYLYGNAGIIKVSHAVDITEEDMKTIYEINFFSNVRLVKEFVKLIINAKGTIVFSGSVTKNIPLHANSLYTSTKAALDQYAQVLHTELRNFDVKVINVVGGYIHTGIFDSGISTVPDDSIYNFEEYTNIFKDRSIKTHSSTADAMTPDVFAKNVVDKIEKAGKNTFRIFEGTKSSTIYWMGLLLSPKKLTDYMLDLFGLNFNYREHLKNNQLDTFV